MVEMELREIQVFHMEPNWQRVLLEEKGGTREFPIYIGESEALYLEMAVKKACINRPLTHDLIRSVAEEFGGAMDRIEVVDLRDETFFGRIVIKKDDGDELSIDARPSDAIILSVKNNLPIFVADHVLDAVCHVPTDENDTDEDDL
jgi:bifunctional DNase/RNase